MKMKEKVFLVINRIKNGIGEARKNTFEIDDIYMKEEEKGCRLVYNIGFNIYGDYYTHPKGWIISAACIAAIDEEIARKAYDCLPCIMEDDTDYIK